MIDLLQIPGTWLRPNPPAGGQDHRYFDDSMRKVILYTGGEADWQFDANGPWSSSGHWKIVKGSHLSIGAIDANAMAAAYGEGVYEFYYHLLAIGDDKMLLGSPRGGSLDMLTWTRVALGRIYDR